MTFATSTVGAVAEKAVNTSLIFRLSEAFISLIASWVRLEGVLRLGQSSFGSNNQLGPFHHLLSLINSLSVIPLEAMSVTFSPVGE